VATDTATALKLLAIAAKHPTQLYIAGTCAVLGLGALAVSYAAIAALARNRGSALGMAGERHPGRPPDCRGGQRRSISRRPVSGLHCNRDS
jgi:hypothetical protein